MAQYGTIITNIGLAQIANAQITQTKVGLEYIALGDGNGAHYVPTQNQTKLVHEVWRGPISELSIDPTNSNRIIIDAVIPVTAGGFTIREIGIFDDKNNLIAVGQYPEKYKPQLSEGVSEETLIHFVIETNNADVVKLTIDPTVIIASRNYVDGKVGQVQTALTEHLADYTKHDGIANATGSANAYAISLNPAPTAYAYYQTFKFKANFANTGPATLNVNGLGAKTIKKNVSTDLVSGDISNGSIVEVVYDGSNFQYLGVTVADRTTWNSKYEKPSAGIPKSDLSSDATPKWDKLADLTLSTNQVANTMITFAGLADYRVIKIIFAVQSDATLDSLLLRLNGDMSALYSYHTRNNTSAHASDVNVTSVTLKNALDTNNFAPGQIEIINEPDKPKVGRIDYTTSISAFSGGINAITGHFSYRNTVVIDSISLYGATQAIVAGSKFSVYGLKR